MAINVKTYEYFRCNLDEFDNMFISVQYVSVIVQNLKQEEKNIGSVAAYPTQKQSHLNILLQILSQSVDTIK